MAANVCDNDHEDEGVFGAILNILMGALTTPINHWVHVSGTQSL